MRYLLVFLLSGYQFGFSQTQEQINNRAVKLLDNEKYDEALPYFEQLVKENPSNTIYRYNRAVTLFNLKRYQEALKDYKALFATLPDESEYAFQIGNAYEHIDSISRAIEYYGKAIDLDQGNFIFFFKRGTLLLKQAHWSKAITDFNASLNLNPEHDNSLHNRAIAFFKSGEEQSACKDWCRASLLGNSYSSVHLKKNCVKYICK